MCIRDRCVCVRACVCGVHTHVPVSLIPRAHAHLSARVHARMHACACVHTVPVRECAKCVAQALTLVMGWWRSGDGWFWASIPSCTSLRASGPTVTSGTTLTYPQLSDCCVPPRRGSAPALPVPVLSRRASARTSPRAP
eukprot:15458699-Alexandrium_andersonii.AAC.1